MSSLIACTDGPFGKYHGEAFLWLSSNDADCIAVDAGNTNGVGARAGSAFPKVLVLSHDDHDHINGATALISAAQGSIEELWVPADWAILIEQIASTRRGEGDTPDTSADSIGAPTISLDFIDSSISSALTVLDGDGQIENTNEYLDESAEAASEQLERWSNGSDSNFNGFYLQPAQSNRRHWYGAESRDEIVDRVMKRAGAITDIFKSALTNSIRIRFFSIDLAMERASFGHQYWLHEGRPGLATMANAAETWRAFSAQIPGGLPYTFALTKLTVQNRRALSTLLWGKSNQCSGGGVVWSDTDGEWLNHSSPIGFNNIVKNLRVSSAPHHASGNPAHDRVWRELIDLADTAPIVCAGGQWNQSYRAEYLSHGLPGRKNRCCTWCRNLSQTVQEVTVNTARAHATGALQQTCLANH